MNKRLPRLQEAGGRGGKWALLYYCWFTVYLLYTIMYNGYE